MIQESFIINGTEKSSFDVLNSIEDYSELTNEVVFSFFKNENLGLENLFKYYLNENLVFLLGSGTSINLGGKTLNSTDGLCKSIAESISEDEKTPQYQTRIRDILLSDDIFEKKVDKINQQYLFYDQIAKNEKLSKTTKEYLDLLLDRFIKEFIPFPSDYKDGKLLIHDLFINKIISRKAILNRPQIYTLNYDLALENACEDIGVNYNNGFRGHHLRKFNPDAFQNEIYIKSSQGDTKRIGSYLNIYKLHGSISWQLSNNENDIYNIKELQVSDDFEKKDFKSDSILIYPLQSKKGYSLDLPFSDLFRSFSKCLTDGQATLVIIGYSFKDEHVNDLIINGLYNPGLSLIIHSYDNINDDSPIFLKSLKERSFSDHRIIIYEGKLLGAFENVVKYLIPLNSSFSDDRDILETVKKLLKIKSV